jgi:hypothetical protein
VDYGACNQNGNTASLQVAEWPGVSVRRGSTGQQLLLSSSVAAPAPDGGTLLNYSYVMGGTPSQCEASLRAREVDGGLVFSRGQGDFACLTVAVDDIHYEYVDFGPLASVQRIAPVLLGNATTGTTAISPVDATRTLVLTGHNLGFLGIGEIGPTAAGGEGPATSLGVHALTGDGGSASSVSTTRSAAVTGANWNASVLTFEP